MKRIWKSYFSFYSRWYYLVMLLVLPLNAVLREIVDMRKGTTAIFLVLNFGLMVMGENQSARGILSYSEEPTLLLKAGAQNKSYLRGTIYLDVVLKALYYGILCLLNYGVSGRAIAAFSFVYILSMAGTLSVRYASTDMGGDSFFAICLFVGMWLIAIFLWTAVDDFKSLWMLPLILAIAAGLGAVHISTKRMEEKYQ